MNVTVHCVMSECLQYTLFCKKQTDKKFCSIEFVQLMPRCFPNSKINQGRFAAFQTTFFLLPGKTLE